MNTLSPVLQFAAAPEGGRKPCARQQRAPISIYTPSKDQRASLVVSLTRSKPHLWARLASTALASLVLTVALASVEPVSAQTSQLPPTSVQGRLAATPLSIQTAAPELPATSWMPGALYPSTIARYAFAQNGEDFYVISGISDSTLVKTVRRYNATTNIWTSLTNIPIPSEAPAGALYNGKIYVAGGLGVAAFQIYDIATNSWMAAPPRPGPSNSFGAAASAFNGNVYIIGGGPAVEGLPIVSIYNIASNTWSTGPAAPVPYGHGGYTQVGSFLYLIGSYTDDPAANSSVSMRFDMATSSWTVGPVWTPQRADFALVAVGSKLFALGGDANGGAFFDASAQVDQLDTSIWPLGTWVSSPDNLPSARQANQAGFFSTGRAGGEIWSTGGVTPELGAFLKEHLFRAQAPPAECSNYNAITSMGNGIVPGTTDTGNHCDDCTTDITFPFPVTLYGTTFITAKVSSNGNIQFTGNRNYLGRTCPLPDPNLDMAIMAYQGELRTDEPGSGIFTSVNGVAPNRIFNVEWRATYFGRPGRPNFEVRFFEATSDFAIIYGETADNGSFEESGVQESATGRATSFSCDEATLPAGLKVTYHCPNAPCNDYTVTPSTRPIVPATTDTGNHCDDCLTAITLPFPISFYGTSYTSANVSSNGNLQFNSNNNSESPSNLPVAGFNDTIFPFWSDLRTDTLDAGIFTSVSGTAPNRAFNVEWRASRFGVPSSQTNFEIQFLEGSTNFEVIYGATVGTFPGAIGLQQAGGALSTQVAGPSSHVPAANTRLVFGSGCCPPIAFHAATGSNSSGYPGTSGIQIGRVARGSDPSVCGTAKAFPGTFDSQPYGYDAYTFINNGPATCVTFSLSTQCPEAQIFSVAYLGSFNPANIAANYLGDLGSSQIPYGSFTVPVPANATVVLVVNEVTAGAGCGSYDVVATGLGCQPLSLTSAASRKTHGSAGVFDVPLPLAGEPGIECRGSGGNHTLVFNFNNLVTSGNAAVTAGTATAGAPSFLGTTMSVPLTGVADIQKITVKLNTVESITGEVLPNTSVSMNILLGDTTGNKSVNASDIAQIKLQSGAAAGAANFRTDTTLSGVINSADVGQVKVNVGHGLP